MVKNDRDNVLCDRAYYSRVDMYTIIMCNKEYKLVCAHAKYCGVCSHYVLKNSAMMCPHNGRGNYKDYKKETNPNTSCGCSK